MDFHLKKTTIHQKLPSKEKDNSDPLGICILGFSFIRL